MGQKHQELQQMKRWGLEERNLARLNPVLALSRVSPDMTGWQKLIQVDELGPVELTCNAGTQLVPHGVDADIIFGLLTAFEFQGRPGDYVIEVSTAQLCEYAGLHRGSDTYKRIQESLERLYAVSFHAESCWGVQGSKGWRWQSLKFGIIDSLAETDTIDNLGSAGKYSPTTLLRIRLNSELLSSIRSGNTRYIDLDFYQSLKLPLTRLLYRLLEEQRAITGESIFKVGLVSWGGHLGIREVTGQKKSPTGVPATRVLPSQRIRRALASAHEELVNNDYLKDVSYFGRGSDQVITYEFRAESPIPLDFKTVGLLTNRGMTLGRSQEFARKYSMTRIQEAIDYFDQRIANGYHPKNRGGFLASIFTETTKYQIQETNPEVASRSSRPQEAAEGAAEPAQPPRSRQQAEAVLLSVLEQTAADRETREHLITQFLEDRHSIMDLISLARLSDAEARTKAAELLAR